MERIRVMMISKSDIMNEDAYEECETTGLQNEGMPPDGLLDCGASHAMRAATSTEYHGHPVQVTLAGEDVKVHRQNLQACRAPFC